MKLPDYNEERQRNRETEFITVNPTISKDYLGKKYFIRTYGCQMNVHDSEEIAGMLPAKRSGRRRHTALPD